MMASNQVVLYIHIRAVSVLYQLSIKVPKAIAVAKRIKSTAINRVEKKNFFSRSVITEDKFDFSTQNYGLFMILSVCGRFKKKIDNVNYLLSNCP
jgi:hypothetical protein